MIEFILLTSMLFPQTEIIWTPDLINGNCAYISYVYKEDKMFNDKVYFSTYPECNSWGIIGHEFRHRQCIDANDEKCFYEVDT